MYVTYNEINYDIEYLAKYSEYFNILKSNSFIENNNTFIDLSHRGQPMKDVLDMIVKPESLDKLPYIRLEKMKPILDEFLFNEYCKIRLNNRIEDTKKEEIIKNAQDKEGRICFNCGNINKWLIPNRKLDYDDLRTYCNCNYIRDDFGNRMSHTDWLEEYYSNETNRKHGSSLFYT